VLKIALWRNEMQYIELKENLKDFTVFSLADIKEIDSHFHRRRLNEWQDKGYIKKIIRGYYIFSDLKLNEKVIFEIANRIYSPSYISFETALAYYGLIPESVYGMTSVSTRRTYLFKTAVAEFSYRTIKPRLFFGYNLAEQNNRFFKIASPEKAVLDYFYINPGIKDNDDFESLRIDKAAFLKLVSMAKIRGFLKKFKQKALKKRIMAFLEFINHG